MTLRSHTFVSDNMSIHVASNLQTLASYISIVSRLHSVYHHHCVLPVPFCSHIVISTHHALYCHIIENGIY